MGLSPMPREDEGKSGESAGVAGFHPLGGALGQLRSGLDVQLLLDVLMFRWRVSAIWRVRRP